MSSPGSAGSPLDRIEDTILDAMDAGGDFRNEPVGKAGVAALSALMNVAKAAEETGWRDADGLCWCEKSTEITKAPHRPQCLRMREALAELEP